MEYAHANMKPVNWTQPTTIKTAPAFIVRNHINLGDIEPSPTNDLYPGWYVGGSGNKSTSQVLDKVSNKVATSCTPALAKETVGNSNVSFWNADLFQGGKPNIGSGSSGSSSASSSATDDVHNCNDAPPTVSLTAPPSCDTSCTITATITQGTHALTDPRYASYPGTVTFTLNGATIHTETVSDSPSTVSFTYSPTSTGSGALSATVTDSVLYSGKDSTTLNFQSASLPEGQATVTATGITTVTATATGGTTNISWSGGTGSYTVTNSTGQQICQTSGNSCSVPTIPLARRGTTVTVRDSVGNSRSATIQ
jgi:hypothetical protein